MNNVLSASKMNTKIKMRYIGLFFILFPFIQQRTMQEFPDWLRLLYEYGSVISATYIYIEFLSLKKQIAGRVKRLLPIFLFWITYVLITVFNYTSLLEYTGKRAYVMLAIAIFVDIEIRRNAEDILKVMAFFYTVYVLVNNILVLLFPNGFYTVTTSVNHKGHLLGDDNAIIYIALPGMIILAVYSLYKYGKISKFTWFNIILCEVVLIRLWSTSAMICFMAFIILLYIGTHMTYIPPQLAIASTAVFAVLVFATVSVSSLLEISAISNFIENVLGKSLTFSNRAYMWNMALELIVKKPLFGYGGYYTVGTYTSPGGYVYPCHTPYLQLLLDGGIVLFGGFCICVWTVAKKLSKYKSLPFAQVITAGLVGILVSYVFEYTQLYHLMILFPVVLNLDVLAQKETLKPMIKFKVRR